MTILVLAWLLLINTSAYVAFRADKMRAVAGDWRVPEAQLLQLALLGGWFGAKLAQRQFRHKTRKQPFARLLNLVPVAWLCLVALVTLGPAMFQMILTAPELLGHSAVPD